MKKNYAPSYWNMLQSRLAGKSFIYEFYFKGKKTLDVGCGEGEFLKHDKELITGFDPNRRVIEKLKGQGFKVISATGQAIPFEDGEFEMAHCHNVIEHLNSTTANAMLNETARVLKLGGCLVLSSEVETRKFWDTFGHVRPYPPAAVLKLLRPESREEFEGIRNFEPVGLFYIGDMFKSKVAYFLSFTLGHFTPIFRREYFLVLRKKSD
ncbi:MAG: class I SAM-dependent methyltransferase [Candidatus Taylorbacteria bacterium]